MDLKLEGGVDGDVDDDGPSRIVLSPRHGCSVLDIKMFFLIKTALLPDLRQLTLIVQFGGE